MKKSIRKSAVREYLDTTAEATAAALKRFRAAERLLQKNWAMLLKKYPGYWVAALDGELELAKTQEALITKLGPKKSAIACMRCLVREDISRILPYNFTLADRLVIQAADNTFDHVFSNPRNGSTRIITSYSLRG